jgi:hypothetical protein
LAENLRRLCKTSGLSVELLHAKLLEAKTSGRLLDNLSPFANVVQLLLVDAVAGPAFLVALQAPRKPRIVVALEVELSAGMDPVQ